MIAPSLRCRFQFSLRTLLIVVTLLAVACSIVVDRQRLIRERDEARQNARDLAERLGPSLGSDVFTSRSQP
ncbi:MAG TPA: hypothetical protein VGY55_06440 [Pirellulales bacterium]|jgi:hypothetical protein|nr:hypothetical protein [Pirellulales bacterium]